MKVDPSIEPPEDREERMFVLRPYVFAAQQYEVYFAPWTIPDLPLVLDEESDVDNSQTGSGIHIDVDLDALDAVSRADLATSAAGLRSWESSDQRDQDTSTNTNTGTNARRAGGTGRGGGRGRPSPFIADLSLKSRQTQIEHYGRKISISTPILSHAAILSFFHGQLGDDDEDEDFDDSDEDEEGEEEDREWAPPSSQTAQNGTGLGNGVGIAQAQVYLVNDMMTNNHLVHAQQPANHDVQNAVDAIVSSTSTNHNSNYNSTTALRPSTSFESTSSSRARKTPRLNSKTHDRDWARLRNCYDPTSGLSPGLSVHTWRGSWSGCWEGNFSFFEFEAFREMLAGQSRALYEGPYGQQAQVWKLTETFVRPRVVKPQVEVVPILNGIGKGKGRAEVDVDNEDENLEVDMEASESDGDEDEEAGSETDKSRIKTGLPLTGPATNAGFPTDQPSSTMAGLATAAAEAYTLRETIRQQVEAIEGYEIIPDHELDEELARGAGAGIGPGDSSSSGSGRNGGAGGGHGGGVEVLLTGTGHSAWGRFILKGRVRTWDGMATLVKEYAVSVSVIAFGMRKRYRWFRFRLTYSPTREGNGCIGGISSRTGFLWAGGGIRLRPRSISGTRGRSSLTGASEGNTMKERERDTIYTGCHALLNDCSA